MDQELSGAPTAICTLGHIDHGKSTTLGHLIYLLGGVDDRTMDKLTAEANEFKRPTWKWAYLFDSTDEERAGGITADIAFYPFSTKTLRRFMLVDAPGHRDFVKNAIKGAILADACIFMVSVNPTDLKAGLKEGGSSDPGGQTREHAILGSVLGIPSVIVCINKMDMVGYSQEVYNDTITTVKKLLREIQSPWMKTLTEESFVPVSGYEGDNLVERSTNMPWYTGPTLAEALDQLPNQQRKSATAGLRFLAFDSYDYPGVGNLLYGRVIQGVLRPNQEIVVLPSGETATVKDVLNVNLEDIPQLFSGEFGSTQVRGPERDRLVPGVLLSSSDSVLKPAKTITARVLVLETAGRPLVPGSGIIIHVGLSHSASIIERIVRVEREKKARKGQKVMLAFPGELVVLELRPDHPIMVEKYQDQPILGRVVLRHSGQTVAVGLVTEILT